MCCRGLPAAVWSLTPRVRARLPGGPYWGYLKLLAAGLYNLSGTRSMKRFGKIGLVFGLLGGLMAYFIIPVQFSRKRILSPAEKAEYVLTVNYYKSHCGPVIEEVEERAQAYARESGKDIWAGYDAMLQHRRPVIGSPTWCRYMGALWLKPH